jgi:arginine/lysine/ornithine decarboxylase
MSAGADVCVVSVHKMGAGFEQGSVYHVQGDLVDPAHLSECADLLMTTSPNVILYSAMDGWRRQMVQHGTELLGNALDLVKRLRRDIDSLPGIHVLEDELLAAESSHDLDRMQILMDVTGLGISGYQGADWLREHRRLDMGLSDHRRIMATLSMADDDASAARLLEALQALIDAAPTIPEPAHISLPSPSELELETVALPRDAFFGPREDVPAREAAGRVAAEQITPYPPGIPVIVPGERINEAVIEYLESGLKAGMVLPDPADPSLGTIRVVKE